MKTAVQLRTLAGDERPRAELLFGTPCDLGEGTLGPIARFESGEVVAYQNPEPAAPAPFRLPYARGRRRLRGRRAGRPPARSAALGTAHGGAHTARPRPVRVPCSHASRSVDAARYVLRPRRRSARREVAGVQDPAFPSSRARGGGVPEARRAGDAGARDGPMTLHRSRRGHAPNGEGSTARAEAPRDAGLDGYLPTATAARYLGFRSSSAIRKAVMDGRLRAVGRRGGVGTAAFYAFGARSICPRRSARYAGGGSSGCASKRRRRWTRRRSGSSAGTAGWHRRSCPASGRGRKEVIS